MSAKARLSRSLWIGKQSVFENEPWRPAVDIYQGPQGWLIKVDLAGVAPEDIELHAQGRTLTIAGARRDGLCREGYCHYHMEIAYNRFERTIELPAEIDADQVAAEHRDGMLLIRIPSRS